MPSLSPRTPTCRPGRRWWPRPGPGSWRARGSTRPPSASSSRSTSPPRPRWAVVGEGAESGRPVTTDAWGIDDGYHDVHHQWRATDPVIAAALRQAMGADGDEPAPPRGRDVRVVRGGAPARLDRPADVRLEDGTELRPADQLAADLPIGSHD